jgi:hypothetical protein
MFLRVPSAWYAASPISLALESAPLDEEGRKP